MEQCFQGSFRAIGEKVGGHCSARNGMPPFEKNASGRQKPFRVELAFTLGKHHPFGFSAKSCRGNENLFGWNSLLRRGSTTRLGFLQKCVGTTKTFSGGTRFRVGETPPVQVFIKIMPGRRKPFWVELAFALLPQKLKKTRARKLRFLALIVFSAKICYPIHYDAHHSKGDGSCLI